jgi:hypothetical protein
LVQERKRIDEVLFMLDTALLTKDDDDTKELASKQRSMWIAELLDDGLFDQVTSNVSVLH